MNKFFYLLAILGIISCLLFVALSGNKYSWMHDAEFAEENVNQTLPIDGDAADRTMILAFFPVIISFGLLLYSRKLIGKTKKSSVIIAIVLLAIVFARILWLVLENEI